MLGQPVDGERLGLRHESANVGDATADRAELTPRAAGDAAATEHLTLAPGELVFRQGDAGACFGAADPFQRFDPPVGYDGPGPNPLLQNHPLMAIHPPMLYLGYVGFTVPFAFAIATASCRTLRM